MEEEPPALAEMKGALFVWFIIEGVVMLGDFDA
jgi:hypothetical protein